MTVTAALGGPATPARRGVTVTVTEPAGAARVTPSVAPPTVVGADPVTLTRYSSGGTQDGDAVQETATLPGEGTTVTDPTGRGGWFTPAYQR